MRAVKSNDTSVELAVRRIAHNLGYRYRLHRRDLPGKPDLVFPGRRKVIFVHGCFWHQHQGCNRSRTPKSNQNYWQPKLQRNVERDARVQAELVDMGWDLLIVWECEVKNAELLKERLSGFLG
jgi:DNA mismatch endonuclease (patch repair protein)